MRNFVIGVIAGIVFVKLSIVAIVWIAPWWWNRPPRITQGTTLVLRLSGSVPEAVPGTLNPLDPPPLTTFAIWDVLRKAAVDPRIAALWVEPDKPAAGWAKLGEIRSAIAAFRKSGKPTVSFLHTPNSRDYYLASATARISVAPADFVDLKGLRVELTYARRALDKLGIIPEVEAIGRYKDGADMATRSSMSSETREVMESILDARFRGLQQAIATGRNKTAVEVAGLLDQGPFLATAAQRAGLVDALEFTDQAESDLARQLKQPELKKVQAVEYQRVSASSLGLEGKRRVALVAVEGDIARSPIPLFAEDVIEPGEFARMMKQLREDVNLAGVILRIDSPGGDAIVSEELLRELKRLADKKPVVISMSDIAASGGYQLAMGGQAIVAYPETLTGSIGVFFGKLALTGLYDKLGIRKELLTRGQFAAIDSDAHTMTLAERRKLREALEQTYKDFVASVAATRKRPVADIERVAQGRVWLGEQAKANGLVDALGGFERAVELLKERAGIPSPEKVSLEIYPRRPGMIESFERRVRPYLGASVAARTAEIRLWKRIPWGIDIR